MDLNPFAVAIARFRLIVAAMHAVRDARGWSEAPGWHVHLAVGDSLLHGDSSTGAGSASEWLAAASEPWADPIYAIEDPAGLERDPRPAVPRRRRQPAVHHGQGRGAQRSATATLVQTCHRQYSLAVPFTERFFDLALAADDGHGRPGYVGQITANSFMKREFGKKLIEEFFPTVDLTHVIDTSGAYIPGHGTPTVILFGRNRRPVGDEVRAVLGIRGEPTTPDDPAQGLVWRSIVDHLDNGQAQNEFVSVTDVDRATFGKHPWSIGGGGAAELKESIESSCTSIARRACRQSIGFTCITGEDDVFMLSGAVSLERHRLPSSREPFVDGEIVRDWSIAELRLGHLFPTIERLNCRRDPRSCACWHLWPYRTTL